MKRCRRQTYETNPVDETSISDDSQVEVERRIVMVKSGVAVGSIALFLAIAVSSPAAAAEVQLTTPAGQLADEAGEAVTTAKGFVLAWKRVQDNLGNRSILLRAFSPAGRPLGRRLVLQKGKENYSNPTVISLGGDRAASFWFDQYNRLFGRVGNFVTGKLGKQVFVSSPARPFADAARLTNRNIQVVTFNYDERSIPEDPQYGVAVTTLSPAMTVIAGPHFLPNSLDNSFGDLTPDFAIVARKSKGAVAVYRIDRLDEIYATRLSPTGRPAESAFKVNVLPVPAGAFGQSTVPEVEAGTLKNGEIVVAWSVLGATADDDFDIHYRLLSEAGIPIGSERVAHDSLAGGQVSPEIVPLTDGGFALSWTDNGDPVAGRERSYVMRRFTAAGLPVGVETTLSSGERGLNGEDAQLVATSPTSTMLIRTAGQLPTTLVGIAAKP